MFDLTKTRNSGTDSGGLKETDMFGDTQIALVCRNNSFMKSS